jgi:hypothetical protein
MAALLAALLAPVAAASTIRARTRSRCSVRPERARGQLLFLGRGEHNNERAGDHHCVVVGSQPPPITRHAVITGTKLWEDSCESPRPRRMAVRMTVAVKFPESTKTPVQQRLLTRARERWPQILELHVDALDLACGLYLDDPTAWHNLRPPTN